MSEMLHHTCAKNSVHQRLSEQSPLELYDLRDGATDHSLVHPRNASSPSWDSIPSIAAILDKSTTSLPEPSSSCRTTSRELRLDDSGHGLSITSGDVFFYYERWHKRTRVNFRRFSWKTDSRVSDRTLTSNQYHEERCIYQGLIHSDKLCVVVSSIKNRCWPDIPPWSE